MTIVAELWLTNSIRDAEVLDTERSDRSWLQFCAGSSGPVPAWFPAWLASRDGAAIPGAELLPGVDGPAGEICSAELHAAAIAARMMGA